MTHVEPTQGGLRLSGFLDVRTVAEARAAFGCLLESGDGDIIVDVRTLVSVDATGLALLLAVHRRALNDGRHLVLDGVTPSLARLLAVTRLHRVLTVRREAGSGRASQSSAA